MTASLEGHASIVRKLIEAKAQVDAQDEVPICCSYTRKHTAQYIICIVM